MSIAEEKLSQASVYILPFLERAKIINDHQKSCFSAVTGTIC